MDGITINMYIMEITYVIVADEINYKKKEDRIFLIKMAKYFFL
jgi:hypothetical protein